MSSSFPIQSVIDGLQSNLGYNVPNVNSVHDFLNRVGGFAIDKTITLNANNTTQSLNIFQLTGTCSILRLYGKIIDATTLVNCTAASWDLFPTGGAAKQITAATGVLSGAGLGSFIFKTGLAANAFALADTTDVQITEQTYEGNSVFNEFMITQKISIDTFLRFTYTTTDTPINAQIKIFCEYREIGEGTLTVV